MAVFQQVDFRSDVVYRIFSCRLERKVGEIDGCIGRTDDPVCSLQ